MRSAVGMSCAWSLAPLRNLRRSLALLYLVLAGFRCSAKRSNQEASLVHGSPPQDVTDLQSPYRRSSGLMGKTHMLLGQNGRPHQPVWPPSGEGVSPEASSGVK